MDHTAVVRDKMTERYLLNELESDIRDEFEEHYFDCPECAQDVSAGYQFVEETKVALAERLEPVPVRATRPDRARGGWYAWLRPAFAAPALALLLVVVGYQNLVTVPALRSELYQPQVLPAVSVNLGTWGVGGSPISIPEGKGLLLLVRIPPDGTYTRYLAELYNPGGQAEGSFTLTPAAGQDRWPVSIPRIERQAGTYRLELHGTTSSGETKDLGSTSFQLQIQ